MTRFSFAAASLRYAGSKNGEHIGQKFLKTCIVKYVTTVTASPGRLHFFDRIFAAHQISQVALSHNLLSWLQHANAGFYPHFSFSSLPEASCIETQREILELSWN